MDGSTFDHLTKTLAGPGSRRRALATSLGGAFGLLGLTQTDAKKKKPCPSCKKRKKGKCKANLPDGTACENGGQCQSGRCLATVLPGPTCTDGMQNGGETGVDCGGPRCPRCLNGQGCTSSSDCLGAFCANGRCQACGESRDCGSDVSGTCECLDDMVGEVGPRACTSRTSPVTTVTACAQCPPGTLCHEDDGVLYCLLRCGDTTYCPGQEDACRGSTQPCGNGGKCFQPLGGGRSRCGVSTGDIGVGSCGCASDQDCAPHGAGAFCVTYHETSTTCSGCPSQTFCAVPR